MGKPHRCVDCKANAPRTNTAHTLIGALHGWRVVRTTDIQRMPLLQWRCPSCWQKFKASGRPEAITGTYAIVPESPISERPRAGREKSRVR